MKKIFVYDEFGPEDSAMMQALYSRSPQSVEEHVEKVRQSGSGKFMSTFYVGYGHSSIADCGSTTIFIEGISILADKIIQDWPLYSGQETSTRYIDMAKQAIVDPLANERSGAILKRWMDFYIGGQERLKPFLIEKYPLKEGEDEKVYLKAINARCFDIMRGFLPTGITTQLSWHTNLRQAWDKLALMRHHPLKEAREIAEEILEKLKVKYENSFSHPNYPEQEAYRAEMAEKYSYFAPENPQEFKFYSDIKREELKKYSELLENRPIKTNLPYFIGDLGNCTFEFLLDFGSYRDIQRHRSANNRMPLLTTELGFQAWYLEQLPEDLRSEAEKLIQEQKTAVDQLGTGPEIKQYYIAMGFNVFCKFTCPLPSAVYITELRSGKTVHPSLRRVAHKMFHALQDNLPEVAMHCDLDLDDWDVRRGLHDISNK
ncbi:MAG: FAD-dependent thymidylate synthase [Candidatus Falkowbacteria bacterium]|nr:FAD-dependent thymidylate synthase [Candidatus Falkowbacteria bacterium]